MTIRSIPTSSGRWFSSFPTSFTFAQISYKPSGANGSPTCPTDICYKTQVGTGEDIGYGANFKNDLEGWTVSNGSESHSSGAMTFSFNGAVDEELTMQASTLDDDGRGYNTVLFGNFLEVEMLWEDLSNKGSILSTNVEDWYISWQTEEGGGEWFTVSQMEWAVNPHEPTGTATYRSNFPLYMHEQWDNKHVTALKVTIKPKAGEALKLNGRLDFIHMMADTRQSRHGLR